MGSPRNDTPGVVLDSGLWATIRPDRFNDDCYELVVDGTPQSHVDLADPTRLFYEYVHRMGAVIDLIGEPGEPITALHLGAGAFTLPRYIAATRRGSRQQVIELERSLVDLVREHLPLPKDASVRVRYGDARATLAALPTGLTGNVDLIVVDVFSGAQTPANVTSVQFYAELVTLLGPKGVVLVNVADGPPLKFARGQAASVQASLANVIALADTQVLKGRRFGNVVLAASNATLPTEWLPRLMASGPHPAKAVTGHEFTKFIAAAKPVDDAEAVPSPRPGRSMFDV